MKTMQEGANMIFTGAEAIRYIEDRKGMKSDFIHVQQLFENHGNFQHSLRVVHVAGTDGKGSTVNFLRSILQAAGYRVGTFTSPYLEVHNDRIRINDEFIPDEDLVRLVQTYQKEFDEGRYSFFEVDTFLALRYFYEQQVDVAIVEVGMGGRLDATNVVIPLVSVITNIGWDHMQYLGDTIEKIAWEKAGIIKPGIPCVMGYAMVDEAKKVIEQRAQSVQAPLFTAPIPSQTKGQGDSLSFKIQGESYSIESPALYQIENASLALSAATMLREHYGFNIPPRACVQGLQQAHWKGRFERMLEDPITYIDGAHNAHGIAALLETLQRFQTMGHSLTLVFTALKDKDTDGMMEQLLRLKVPVRVTQFDFDRAKAADDIADHYPVKVCPDWQCCINEVLEEARRLHQVVIITGSLYFITLAREYLLQIKDVNRHD
jgi:dihydrofolate synthase/folylpolyglutamate synthase